MEKQKFAEQKSKLTCFTRNWTWPSGIPAACRRLFMPMPAPDCATRVMDKEDAIQAAARSEAKSGGRRQEGIGRYEGTGRNREFPPRTRVTVLGIGNETRPPVFSGAFSFRTFQKGVLTLFAADSNWPALITTHCSQNPAPDDRKPELYPKGVKLRPRGSFRVSANSSSRIIRFSTVPSESPYRGTAPAGTEGKARSSHCRCWRRCWNGLGIGYPRGDTRQALAGGHLRRLRS